ncbi:hypothetical protein BZK32_18250 [Escherichia coli]|nr:hypothetical protein BZK32_18250 [Escherichia coli]
MSRDPPQRRRARARNGVAPYIPAAFCRDARSAGHGATEASTACPCITCFCCPVRCSDRPGKPPADSPQNRRFHQQSARW